MFKNKQYFIISIIFISFLFVNSVFALMPQPASQKASQKKCIQAKTDTTLKKTKPIILDPQSFLYKMDILNQKIQILEKQAKITELQNKIKKNNNFLKKDKKDKIDFISTQRFNSKLPKLPEKKEKKKIKKRVVPQMPFVINEEGQGNKIFATLLYPDSGQTQIVQTGEKIFLFNKFFRVVRIGQQGVILQDVKHPKKGMILNLSFKLAHQIITNPKSQVKNNDGRYGLKFLENQKFSDSTYNKSK